MANQTGDRTENSKESGGVAEQRTRMKRGGDVCGKAGINHPLSSKKSTRLHQVKKVLNR